MYKQYNTNQLSLELNLAWELPAMHEARLISQFVDTITQSILLEETSHTGRLCSSGLLWSKNSPNE